MARQIVVLKQHLDSAPGLFVFDVALWAAVPASRQAFYANPSAVSAVTNASPAELTAIQTGAVAEQVIPYSILNGGQTLAALFPTIQTQLQAKFAEWQSQVNAFNPWVHFGTAWDGTTWTVVTVA